MEKGLMDINEEELIREFSDGISDYIHGDAREHVASAIASSGEDLDDTIAALSYQILTQTSEQIAGISPDAVTVDVLLPLATEAIDYLIEIAEAVGAMMPDPQDTRERSFIKMVEIHMAKVGDDPEQAAMAQEMFAELMDDGTFSEAESFVSERIKAEGGDPARAKSMGAEMLQPQPDPLAAGVQQGLMGETGMNPEMMQ